MKKVMIRSHDRKRSGLIQYLLLIQFLKLRGRERSASEAGICEQPGANVMINSETQMISFQSNKGQNKGLPAALCWEIPYLEAKLVSVVRYYYWLLSIRLSFAGLLPTVCYFI